MKKITSIVLMLAGLLSLTAHTASFDCGKASTKVEKLICADINLSKLDEDLNAAYKIALKDHALADMTRRDQKLWIKRRNACTDIPCLQIAYRTRIHFLSDTPEQAVPKSATPEAEKVVIPASEKKYPPYPNVWHWEYKTDPTGISPNLFLVSNGDILAGNKLLFGGQATDYIPDAFFPLDVTRDRGVVHLSDGTQVSGVKAGGISGLIKLSSGVEVVGSDNPFVKCYHGPVSYSFYTQDIKNGKYGPHKVIFILLEKPKQRIWDRPRPSLPESNIEVDPCTEEGPPGYTTRVEAVWGGQMFPLDDGTFLLPMNNGLIVRFDEHFNTQSPLLNRRFFVFDLKYDKNQSENESDNGLYINEITGKKYNLEKTGYQPVYDDLYQYLINIRSKQP